MNGLEDPTSQLFFQLDSPSSDSFVTVYMISHTLDVSHAHHLFFSLSVSFLPLLAFTELQSKHRNRSPAIRDG